MIVRDNVIEGDLMTNVTYKKIRKLKNGKIEVEFVDAAGNTKKEVCHDPISCREHSYLFSPLAAGLGTMLKGLDEEDDADDSVVSAEDYSAKANVEALYDKVTIEVLKDSDGGFQFAPNTGVVECSRCDGELEFRRMQWSNDSYSGKEVYAIHKGHPEKDFFSNSSLNNNLGIEGAGAYGSEPSGERHHSGVPSWCRKCGTLGSLVLHMDSYYDRTTCSTEGCGFEVSYPIGD